ncbi:hypothetical protein [Ruegeria sp. HKCCD7221]|uniref:hypothetical protein n=1 Tax=Ruegeria sp. HKCCD7221 TaxID=2683009 RepID=UPI0014886983|nr:hypothetical protein [Ruegeria sp. HKCCD7221]
MITCASATCDNPLPANEYTQRPPQRWGLCSRCRLVVENRGVPLGGFVAGGAINAVARSVLRQTKPTPSEVAEAVRLTRGTRHRIGDWDGRPAYRMAALRHGRARERLQHLLVGRRYEPNASVIVRAFVHYSLAREFLGTGHRYNVYLSGGTFMGRQGLCAPPGRKDEVLTGDVQYSKYRLSYADFAIVGTHALRAAERLGLRRSDGDLRAFIVTSYGRLLASGDAHPPVSVPIRSMRTDFLGDSLFDHVLPRSSKIPFRYHKAIRRSSGLISGEWPEGLDPVSDLTPRPSPPPKPNAVLKAPSMPDPSWLFAKT